MRSGILDQCDKMAAVGIENHDKVAAKKKQIEQSFEKQNAQPPVRHKKFRELAFQIGLLRIYIRLIFVRRMIHRFQLLKARQPDTWSQSWARQSAMNFCSSSPSEMRSRSRP
jgi:hypothetical protein